MAVPENVEKLYEKYAPKNVTLEQFAKMVERDPKLLADIGGNFSTFNADLAKKYRKYSNRELVRQVTGEGKHITDDEFHDMFDDIIDKDVAVNVVERYVKAYTEIICSDDDILQDVWTFDILDKKQRKELAKKIIEGINKYFGIQDKIKVTYAEKYSEEEMLPDYMAVLRKRISDFIDSLMDKLLDLEPVDVWWNNDNTNGKYNSKDGVIGVFHGANFISFISTLAHEYGHFIDDKYPNIGMLGSQISFYADSILKQMDLVGLGAQRFNKLYMKNPTEQSSRRIETYIEYGNFSKILNQQKYIKKDLYIQTMQKAIYYIEMKLEAIRLKYKKFFSWLKEQNPTMSTEHFSFWGDWRLKGITGSQDVKEEYAKYIDIASEFSAEYEKLNNALKKYKYSLQEFINSENNNNLSNTDER